MVFRVIIALVLALSHQRADASPERWKSIATLTGCLALTFYIQGFWGTLLVFCMLVPLQYAMLMPSAMYLLFLYCVARGRIGRWSGALGLIILLLWAVKFINDPYNRTARRIRAVLLMSHFRERRRSLARDYAPLNVEQQESMLLVLWPSGEDGSADIVATLETFSLREPPPYEALSWSWTQVCGDNALKKS